MAVDKLGGGYVPVQVDPFQKSVNGTVLDEPERIVSPANMQNEDVAHDTANTRMSLLNSAVMVVAVQLEPFHCSTRPEPPVAPAQPTATQNDALVQETPDKKVGVVDNGLDWATLQAVPFHCSISGAALLTSTEPTATQNDVVTQDTPDR